MPAEQAKAYTGENNLKALFGLTEQNGEERNGTERNRYSIPSFGNFTM